VTTSVPTILCFGDSNTWGFSDDGSHRYGLHERWPGVLRDELGPEFGVIEEGLCGRTTIHDDPFEDFRNGLEYLRPCLDSHVPDLILLMLGTNDLKHRFRLSAWDIAAGVGKLATYARTRPLQPGTPATQVLLVCPPPVLETGPFVNMFAGAAAKSRELAPHYRAFATETGSAFFDTGTVITSSPVDGIHWKKAEHRKLGQALAAEVRRLIPECAGRQSVE